jgi:hypothetical protein
MKFTLETLPNISEFIKNQIPFNELKKGEGIFETDFINNSEFTLGVSFEDNDDGEEVYIYNIFAGDEYINIAETGNKENITPNAVIDEIIDMLLKIEYEEQ